MVDRLLLASLFFAIGLGLGYPILNRYDPREVHGTSDVRNYAAMVEHGLDASSRNHREFRVLVPWVAQPIYRLAKGRVRSWDPVLLSLLISASIFCAGTALLIFEICAHTGSGRAQGLTAGLLYLASFSVPNFQLVGLSDSGEAFMLTAAAWLVVTGRFRWLPLVGVGAGLARESAVVLVSAMTLGGWLASGSRALRGSVVASVGLTLLCALAASMAVRFALSGSLEWPWQLAAALRGPAPLLSRVVDSVADRAHLYTFAWLVPLGVWQVGRLPRPWVVGALSAAAAALLLGSWHGAGGNTSRPLFNALGPMLCASTALLLLRSRAETR